MSVVFFTEISVRVDDINYGRHLGHDRLVSLLHQARLDFLHALGGSELDFFGVGLIMRRLQVDYLAEAFLGDVLRFEVAVEAHRKTGFVLSYKVLRSDVVVALAKTEMVAFDYERRRVCALPCAFVSALEG